MTSEEQAALKKRLMTMIVIDGLLGMTAVASAVGAFVFKVEPLKAVFVVALLGAFAMQFWFIAGVRRAKRGV